MDGMRSVEIAMGELHRKERDRSADERGCDVKRGNNFAGELRQKERDRSAGRAWLGCQACKLLGGSSEQTGVLDERG